MQFEKLYDIIPLFRKRLWPLGQAAKTAPSHGAIMGSIPVGVTKKRKTAVWRFFFFCPRESKGAVVNDVPAARQSRDDRAGVEPARIDSRIKPPNDGFYLFVQI